MIYSHLPLLYIRTQMKTAYIFKIAMIAIVSFISMASCSKDNDDDILTCQANAKGVCLIYDDDFVEAEDSKGI